MKKLLFYFSIGVLIEFCTAPLRAINFNLAGATAFLFYTLAFLYFILLKKTNARNEILIAFLISFFLLNIVPRLFDFNLALVSLPYCFFNLLGIMLGYILTNKNTSKISKAIFSVCFVFLLSIFYIKGSSLWIHYLSYKTFTGNITPYNNNGLALSTINNKTITDRDLKGNTKVNK